MRPPVRPPQLRCVFFSSMYLPHLLVLPATFWTSVPFATLSVFPSLICGSCPSGQRFAYSFFQIPSHGGHPCCSAMCFVVAYAHLGLSPIRKRPCWANKMDKMQPLSSAILSISFHFFRLPTSHSDAFSLIPTQIPNFRNNAYNSSASSIEGFHPYCFKSTRSPSSVESTRIPSCSSSFFCCPG